MTKEAFYKSERRRIADYAKEKNWTEEELEYHLELEYHFYKEDRI